MERCPDRFLLALFAGDGQITLWDKDCGTLGCPACGPKEHLLLAEHLLAKCPPEVYAAHLPAEVATENRAKQRLRKSEGMYMYRSFKDGSMFVIGTHPVGVKGRGGPSWALEPMTALQAADRLAALGDCSAEQWSKAHSTYTFWDRAEPWRMPEVAPTGRYISSLAFKSKKHAREAFESLGFEWGKPLENPVEDLRKLRFLVKGEGWPEFEEALAANGGKFAPFKDR